MIMAKYLNWPLLVIRKREVYKNEKESRYIY